MGNQASTDGGAPAASESPPAVSPGTILASPQPKQGTAANSKTQQPKKVQQKTDKANKKKGKTFVQPTPEQAAKRTRIVDELVDTETSYVSSLRACVKHFLEPMRASRGSAGKKGTKKGGLITVEDERTIFSILEAILQLHEQMLQALREKRAEPDLSSVFTERSEFLRMYTTYVNNYNDSMTTLARRREKNPALQAFLTDAQSKTPGYSDLPSFLIMPVQRLPRYIMLLQEIIKNTPVGGADRAGLEEALRRVQHVTADINEKKRDAENVQRIVDISSMIQGYSVTGVKNAAASYRNLLQPHRRLLEEGQCRWLKKWDAETAVANNTSDRSVNNDVPSRQSSAIEIREAQWFLLTDMLLICKSERSGLLRSRSQTALKVVFMTRLGHLDIHASGTDTTVQSSWLSRLFSTSAPVRVEPSNNSAGGSEDTDPALPQGKIDDRQQIEISQVVQLGIKLALHAHPVFLAFSDRQERDAWVALVHRTIAAASKLQIGESEQQAIAEEERQWNAEQDRLAALEQARAEKEQKRLVKAKSKGTEKTPLMGGKNKKKKKKGNGCCG